MAALPLCMFPSWTFSDLLDWQSVIHFVVQGVDFVVQAGELSGMPRDRCRTLIREIAFPRVEWPLVKSGAGLLGVSLAGFVRGSTLSAARMVLGQGGRGWDGDVFIRRGDFLPGLIPGLRAALYEGRVLGSVRSMGELSERSPAEQWTVLRLMEAGKWGTLDEALEALESGNIPDLRPLRWWESGDGEDEEV